MLVFFRLSGLFMIAPVLASASIPVKARVLLVLALTICIFPLVPAAATRAIPSDIISLSAAAALEIGLGFSLGLLMLLPIAAVQLAGVIMGQQLGFGLAQVINPALETESDLLSETLTHIALVGFIALGGLEVLFIAVANTFQHVPLGGVAVSALPGDMILGAFGGGLELALRIASPVLGILFVETIASAFIMKTMPQVNIMTIGFAIKIVVGLLALTFALHAVDSAATDSMASAARRMLNWSTLPH